MPRPCREEVPDGIFHIATRSVFERVAFDGVDDREDFIRILANVVERCRWNCKSYCLMGTHYHLIVQTPEPNLSVGMQLLNGRYAQRFNQRRDRRGHLFSERFYSVLVETERHLAAVLRYVARNPVEAGLCAGPSDWRWGSYRSLIGKEPALRLLDVDGVLELFSPRREVARSYFAAFVEDPAGLDASDEVFLAGTDGV
jgi:putative transposase